MNISDIQISKLDELWSNVRMYRKSDNFLAVMNACAHFRHLAPFNAMLVQMQRPGAQYVLTEAEWRNKYNRKIKPNARPVIVLVPFGPVDYLFEISDTYPDETIQSPQSDADIIQQIAEPYKTKQPVSDNIMDNIIANLPFYSIALDTDFIAGAGYGARIELLEDYSHNVNMQIKKDTIKYKADYLLSVNKNAEKGERFASICHELGHLFCYHLIFPEGWDKWKVRNLSQETKEFEAESISWLICERFGIHNPSEKYLSGYLQNNNEIPPFVSIENILSAAKEILTMCNSKMKYKEGWLYKKNKKFIEITTQL